MNHNSADWTVFKSVFSKFSANFLDFKIWLFTFSASPVFLVTEKYFFADWQFLKYLGVLVMLDTITGVMKAVKRNEAITSYGLRRTVVKIVQYGIFLIVVHVLDNFEVKGESISFFGWIVTAAYSFLIGVEAKSVLENIMALNDKFDIQKFIEKITESIKK